MSISIVTLFFLPLLFAPATQAQLKHLTSFSRTNPPWYPSNNQTLVSPNQTFVAGFHRLRGSSPLLYIFAIWYRNTSEKTIVWSLNGDSPVNNSSPLSISATNTLNLNNPAGHNIWRNAAGNPNSSLLLGDDGNLVFNDWTSFANPTDTILPNQPMNNLTLFSRPSKDTFGKGLYQFIDLQNLVYNYSDQYYTSGNAFGNLTSDGTLVIPNGNMVSADVGANRSRRFVLDVDGNLKIYSLDPISRLWKVVWRAVQEVCTIHGTCGPNFICMSNGSTALNTCICPPGFRSTNPDTCEIGIELSPDPRLNKFLRLDFVNFTGGSNQTNLGAANLSACESTCSADPRCLGFAFKFDGTGYCVHQIDRLLYGYWSPATQVAMYLKVSKSEPDNQTVFGGMNSLLDTVCPVRIRLPFPPKQSDTTTRDLSIISSLFALELIGGVLIFWAFLRKYTKYRDLARTFGLEFLPAGGPKRFSYAELKAATKDFSAVVGQGGFGVVYRGELSDGRIVAVKRLKNVSGGEAEFWAEVTIIARMHHLNLVRMWGFCADKSQRMLVYEYIPNGSLDKFLFPSHGSHDEQQPDEKQKLNPRKPMLDWSIRYRIAVGVARAIAYLHEECLEWVLHCDIKPENILLEDDFCPKVSDFGLAKLAKKEDKVSMSRIRGTRGYLAPEWVKSEPITAKADVYSFGMVLLEIVSGVRNFEFRRSSLESDDWYFPRWAYDKIYTEKKVEDILDHRILDSYDNRLHFAMVERMVKTAMWCLQDRPETRPSMGKVAKMLEGTVEITEPGKPTIFYLNDT